MNALLLQLPEWLSIGTIISVAVALVTFVASIVKLAGVAKQSKISGEAQFDLLKVMSEKLSDTNNVIPLINKLSSNLSEILDVFIDTEAKIRKSNEDTVKFILECFRMSNLTDENKSKLSLLASSILYPDNEEALNKLKSVNESLTAELSTKAIELDQLTAKLSEFEEKLKTKPVVTNKRTRVV